VASALSHAIAPSERVSSPESTLLARRVPRVVVASLGVSVGTAAFALLATSDHLLHPDAYGLAVANVVIGSVGVALYWAARRPGNRLVVPLLAYAGAAAVIGLQGAADPLLHSIGVLFDPVLFVLGYVVVFCFPEGRLSRRLERSLVAAMAVVVVVGFLPWFFFSPVVAGGNPLAGCNAACPHNALMIADRPGIASGLGDAEEYATVVVAVAIAAALLFRLARSTRPRRRASIPVYVPALLLTVPFAIFHAWGADWISLTADQGWKIGWLVNAGRATLAYGLALAILQADLAAGIVFKRVMSRLAAERHPDAADLRDTMADVLDDRSLELAFRVGRSPGYVDSRGRPADPAHPAGRASTAVTRRGEPVAYLLHDRGLGADPELLGAAGQAVLLALESGRLERELEARTAELRDSRVEVAAAGDAERRRIEQDLHDGAQQHLIALRIKLELARELAADETLDGRLVDLGDELEDVLHELRALAHDGYPPVLRDGGLVHALSAAARRSARPVALQAQGVGRQTRAVESAVYFCCVEALQNVAKHAGDGVDTTVRIWSEENRLLFEVRDDGIGFDATAERNGGSGLANMSERVAPLGGAITVESVRGAGTCVRGSVSTAEARIR